MRSRGQISLILVLMSISKVFLSNFLCRKHIEQNFHSVAGVMSQWWDLGVLGVKNFSVGICDGALSTVHSSSF